MANFVIFSDQIGMNSEVKKQERLDYLEEGRKVRQRIEDERLKVERIKKSKLDGLVGLGIEGKYQADLAKKRILWGVTKMIIDGWNVTPTIGSN